MTALEALQMLHIDGDLIGGIQQITVDAEKTTVIYGVAKESGEIAQRVITVETEAVSIG